MFLTSPDQIRFLQFQCPYPEIRFFSAVLIIYVCHLCMKDPSVQCEDILQPFILLVNNPTTTTPAKTHATSSGGDNTVHGNPSAFTPECTPSTSTTSPTTTATATTSLNNVVTANNTSTTITTTSTATTTTASILSYLLKSSSDQTNSSSSSPIFVDHNSSTDSSSSSAQMLTARIFSATCFINRLINLPRKLYPPHSSIQNDRTNNSNTTNNSNSSLLPSQLINPGECLIQFIIHQLHFSPNTFSSPSPSSNKSFQQQHQSYSAQRPGNPSSSTPSASSSSALYHQSTSFASNTSNSNNINNNSYSLSSTASTICPPPSSVIWAQYFAILLDFANYGQEECCYLLKLHVPEILINYMLSYEVMLTTVSGGCGTSATTTSLPNTLSTLLTTTPITTTPATTTTGRNHESHNYHSIQTIVKQLYNELSMEIQLANCTNLSVSSSLNAFIYALFTASPSSSSSSSSITAAGVSNVHFDFQHKYDDCNDTVINNEQNHHQHHHENTATTPTPTSTTIMYCGLKCLLDLLSYLIRSCEIPSQYLHFSSISTSTPSSSSSSSTSTCLSLASSSSSSSSSFTSVISSTTATPTPTTTTTATATSTCQFNATIKHSKSNETFPIASDHHKPVNQLINPYCATTAKPLITLSNTLAQLFLSDHQTERILIVMKRLTGSLLNSITLKPISDIFLFFSYENLKFSDLILRELIYCILHPCDLDSVLKLLECLLQITDSLKSIRICLLFKYSNDANLFKLLNSNFIYESNMAAYHVFNLYINLLLTDTTIVMNYLSNEIYLMKLFNEVTLSALASLKLHTSNHNWPDGAKDKTMETLQQAERILMNLMPSIMSPVNNNLTDVIDNNNTVQHDESNDVVDDDDIADMDMSRFIIGNSAKPVDNRCLIRRRTGGNNRDGEDDEDDVDVDDVEDEPNDDNDNYCADDDSDDDDDNNNNADDDEEEEESEDAIDDGGNDDLIKSLYCITAPTSLTTSDDAELDHLRYLTNDYMIISRDNTAQSSSSSSSTMHPIVDVGTSHNHHPCITAGPPATNTYTTITTASSSNNNHNNNNNNHDNSGYIINNIQQIYGHLLSYGGSLIGDQTLTEHHHHHHHHQQQQNESVEMEEEEEGGGDAATSRN
ncbi:unnamed protein product [Schistosoma turkestanicum]|nr:unnamed protein product [Schistosoma turkestanicum]